MSDFTRLLSLLGREGDTIRVCRGTPDGGFSAYPVDWAMLDGAVAEINSAPDHGWYEINPSNYTGQRGRSNAADITRLTCVYADIDIKPSGMGSLLSAEDLINDLSAALGVWPAAVVETGGGLHAYWPLEDGMVATHGAETIRRLLRRWGRFVKQSAAALGGNVDAVFDLPRILRIPGTYNVKTDTPVPVLVQFPKGSAPLTVAELVNVLDDYDVPDLDDNDPVAGAVVAVDDWAWAEADCSFCSNVRAEIQAATPPARHPWLLQQAAILHGMVRNGCVTEATFYETRDLLVARFAWLCQSQKPSRQPGLSEVRQAMTWAQHQAAGWDDTKLAEEMRHHQHDDFIRAITEAPQAALQASPQTSAVVAEPPPRLHEQTRSERTYQGYTDTGNAERFARWVHGRYLWMPKLGWHAWDGTRWVEDEADSVVEAAKDMLVYLRDESKRAADDDGAKWWSRSLDKARLRAMIDLAKSIPALVAPLSRVDSEPYELATPGGIVDLRTGVLRPADPRRDYNTKRTNVTPDPTCPTPEFDKFLAWALGGSERDDERIPYMQRLFGAAAIGEVRWHVLPVCVGVGANGKSTLMDIIRGAFGDYAITLPGKFLTETRGNDHPTAIAQLKGARLAVASEVPPTSRFDEELAKTITGETELRARYIGKDFFSFPNTVTMFLLANHLPSVPGGGPSFWRRIRKIDFRKQVIGSQTNSTLARDILAAEAPGILAWIVEGARIVNATGTLDDPRVVTEATREYQLEEDAIARFLNEYIDDAADVQVSRQVVYNTYKSWCYDQNLNPLPGVKFEREVVAARPAYGLASREFFSNAAIRVTQSQWDAEYAKEVADWTSRQD